MADVQKLQWFTGYDFKRLFTSASITTATGPLITKRCRACASVEWTAPMRDDQMTAEHVIRKDVILARARKNGLKERPVAILGYLLTAGKNHSQTRLPKLPIWG